MSKVFEKACELIEKQRVQDENLVLFVVGPTASGKTSLALELAKKYSGEIISLDSRQFYKRFDIGTDKIKKEDMDGIPHHLIDVNEGDNVLTLVDVMKIALEAIKNCLEKGKLPICAGGTGLYIDALCRSYNDFETKKFEGESGVEDVIRLREEIGVFKTLEIAIDRKREDLYEKINKRVDEMFEEGLIEEVKGLMGEFEENLPSMSGIGYRQVISFLKGEIDREEAKELVKRDTRRYAKRQMTWFRHHGDIHWL